MASFLLYWTPANSRTEKGSLATVSEGGTGRSVRFFAETGGLVLKTRERFYLLPKALAKPEDLEDMLQQREKTPDRRFSR